MNQTRFTLDLIVAGPMISWPVDKCCIAKIKQRSNNLKLKWIKHWKSDRIWASLPAEQNKKNSEADTCINFVFPLPSWHCFSLRPAATAMASRRLLAWAPVARQLWLWKKTYSPARSSVQQPISPIATAVGQTAEALRHFGLILRSNQNFHTTRRPLGASRGAAFAHADLRRNAQQEGT